jgi:hypothetical protein
MKGSVLFILMLFSLAACRRSSLPLREYINYVETEEKGLKRTVVIDGWEYNFQYKPYDYIIAQELKGQHNDSFYKQRLKQLQGTAWFNVRFKKQNSNSSPLRYNATSQQEYEARYSYYLSSAMKDLALIYGSDTLHPISYVFETSYNLAPQETMVVGFALPYGDTCPVRPMKLAYYERVFKNGIIKASFDEQTLKAIPKLQSKL